MTFAVFDVSVAVNVCINYSFLHLYLFLLPQKLVTYAFSYFNPTIYLQNGIISVLGPKSVITMVHIYIKVYEVSSFDGFRDIVVDMPNFLGLTRLKPRPLSVVMYASRGKAQDEAEHQLRFF